MKKRLQVASNNSLTLRSRTPSGAGQRSTEEVLTEKRCHFDRVNQVQSL